MVITKIVNNLKCLLNRYSIILPVFQDKEFRNGKVFHLAIANVSLKINTPIRVVNISIPLDTEVIAYNLKTVRLTSQSHVSCQLSDPIITTIANRRNCRFTVGYGGNDEDHIVQLIYKFL